ncbi:ABC transporter substrate-binding protein [Paenibacillus mendelii]|uniref:ABC transporter substrate-binding protein n=1 Tax=Paenibacillus mendelii TaxID=206163 RepID=A0ABV6J2M7_9BACL|nr:sugar ABC transporter substrate-binding protein [Paenibacillus mendelii]MCQ6559242.1 sugar ABC transporter substrate-binding protein [Paenibacillus mendelii]
MKAVKAVLSLSLIIAMLVVTAACSSGNSSSETNASKGGADNDAQQNDGSKEVTIKYSRWATGEEEVNFRAWLDEFEKSHPNIKVESEFMPYDTYNSKVKTDLISGNAPDVIGLTASDWSAYIYSNVFLDLNTLPGAKEVFGQLTEDSVTAFNVEGAQLGAPVGVGRRVPFINKDLFAKANVPLPSQTEPMTAAQWVDMMKKVQAGLDGDMMAANLFPEELLDSLALSAGAPILSQGGKKVMINTPEGVKAIQAFKDIMASGAQVPILDVWKGAYGNPDSALSTGKVAIGWTGTWSVGSMKEGSINYMSIPAPIVEGGKVTQVGYLNSHVIPAASKNKEAAWELVQWMVSKEGQLSFGKFSDLPVHKEALDETQKALEAEDPDAFTGFAAAKASVVPTPPFPSDFDTLRKGLQSKVVSDKVTAQQFAEQLEKDGQPMLDKYQANIGK